MNDSAGENQGENGREKMLEQIKESEERKQRARSEKRRNLWFGLGVMGVVGWSVVIPTLLGIFAGIWLDSTFPSNIPWTPILLVLGLVIGCLNAWFWVQKELSSLQKEREEKKRE